MRMRARLGWLMLLLVVCGLSACMASASLSAEPLVLPTATPTLPPAATATSTIASVRRAVTRTPSSTPRPTRTATSIPTPTETQPAPTPTSTPLPASPPQWDGILRTADVPILMYHYISAAPTANDRIRYGLSVPPEMFDAQLQLLQDNGFTTITLRQLYDHLAIGTPLPAKPIVLTFDDGYSDNYTNAFPILRKYGMVGTFFVLTGRADEGDPAYLTWDMITTMSNAGMDLQLHLRDHLDMRNRSYEWLVFQVIGGRQSIEGHTGKPVIFMAYPSGKYDANVLRFLSSINFWAAVTTANGTLHTLKDALIWDRVRIAGQLRLQDFAKLLGLRQTTSQRVKSSSSPTPTSTPTFASAPAPTHAATRTLEPTNSPTPTPFSLPPSTQAPTGVPRSTNPATAPPSISPPSTQPPLSTPFPSPLVTPPPSPLLTPEG